MSVSTYQFGVTSQGETVTCYEIKNKKNTSLKVLDYGAILNSLCIYDKENQLKDVVLGYDSITNYESNPPYFGGIVGRNASRIPDGTFQLDGKTYHMPINEGDYNLHSGPNGYEKRMWKAEIKEEQSVSFSLFSPHLDQGIPGNFNITVTYSLSDDNQVSIVFEGKSDEDTLANMINHAYFNLSGHSSDSVLDHEVMIHADAFTAADSRGIPTGEITSVFGTPFDFTVPKTIGKDLNDSYEQLSQMHGYDVNFVLNKGKEKLREVAKMFCKSTGIEMTIITDQPGAQFYSGNFISGPSGKDGVTYVPHQGFCFETQHFPNAINIPSFESPILKKGDTYHTETSFVFRIKDMK